jgi:hypothetical protein
VDPDGKCGEEDKYAAHAGEQGRHRPAHVLAPAGPGPGAKLSLQAGLFGFQAPDLGPEALYLRGTVSVGRALTEWFCRHVMSARPPATCPTRSSVRLLRAHERASSANLARCRPPSRGRGRTSVRPWVGWGWAATGASWQRSNIVQDAGVPILRRRTVPTLIGGSYQGLRLCAPSWSRAI